MREHPQINIAASLEDVFCSILSRLFNFLKIKKYHQLWILVFLDELMMNEYEFWAQSRKRKQPSTNGTPKDLDANSKKKRVRFSDIPDVQDDESDDAEDVVADAEEDSPSDDGTELREDIYGRLRDKKGNIL